MIWVSVGGRDRRGTGYVPPAGGGIHRADCQVLTLRLPGAIVRIVRRMVPASSNDALGPFVGCTYHPPDGSVPRRPCWRRRGLFLSRDTQGTASGGPLVLRHGEGSPGLICN